MTVFADYFEDWINTYKAGSVRDVTLQKWLLSLKHVKALAPNLELEKMTRRDYQKLLNDYAKTHEKVTTNDFHTHLKAAIHDALHDGMIKIDPTYRAVSKGVVQRKKKKKFLSLAQTKRLIDVLILDHGLNVDWFIFMQLKTGMRFAEGLGLTPRDFDFTSNLISINKTLNYKNGGGWQPTKNKASIRTISVDNQLVKGLKPLIANLPVNESVFYHFLKYNETANDILDQRCKEAEIPIISIHGLRHTHASILLSAGVSIHSISKRLGHSNVSTTERVYTHIIDELAAKDGKTINNVLSKLAS